MTLKQFLKGKALVRTREYSGEILGYVYKKKKKIYGVTEEELKEFIKELNI